MTVISEINDNHHFNGFNTRLVLEYLAARLGRPAVDELLMSVGEERSFEFLVDDAHWSSYDQLRAIFEAAAAHLGEDGMREVAGTIALGVDVALEAVTGMQQFGSVVALLRDVADSGSAFGVSTLVTIGSVEEHGEGVMLASSHLAEGFEPFREWCWYFGGLIAVAPKLFGLPAAVVTEVACQCDGADGCRWRIELPRVSVEELSVDEQLAVARAQVDGLQGRLREMQESVAELVAVADIEETLRRIGHRAGRVVRTPGYVFHLPHQQAAPATVSEALDARTVAAVVDRLGRSEEAEPGMLTVRVTSGHTDHGWLALVEPGRTFLSHERAAAESYARLAAAAMDSAEALHQAKRQAATAHALLELSTALGATTTEGEIAMRLCRATPEVVDCDQVLVAVADGESSCYVAACHGFAPELGRRLIGTTFDFRTDGRARSIVYLAPDHPMLDESMAEWMQRSGAAGGIIASIDVEGRSIGYLVLLASDRPERLARTPALDDRLRGLVGQASAAFHNTRLVDAIRHQALHDALTGMPNRLLVFDRARHLLERARRGATPVAVMFVDLDGFKEVNDEFGHAAGDDVLKSAAARLSNAVRDADSVGRIGGDEFVVLLEDTDPPHGRLLVANRILEAFRRPFEVLGGDRAVHVTASIGVAVGSPVSVDDLLRDADVALYQAKAAGRNQVVVFDPELGAATEQRLAFESELHLALDRDQYFLLYQPLYDLSSVDMVGVEVLLRWRHPTMGIVEPDEFLPILESNGSIVAVGRHVLREACAQAATWRASGHPLDVSVNVSRRQLEAPGFIEDLAEILADTGLPHRCLVLELSEMILMRNVVKTSALLDKVRELGVRVAIDDFGAGYSAMANLGTLPVDALKIDRSYVVGLGTSPESLTLVRSFVDLARLFGLESFAVGIEEQQQLDQLQAENCQTGQGYLLSRPTDARGIEAFLAGRGPSGDA